MARAGKKKGRPSKKQRLRLAARAAGASTDGADVDASNGETDAGQQRGAASNDMRKGPHPSLAYLTLWKNNRDAWKFNKKDQTYLLKHAFDSHVVTKNAFDDLLEYIEGMQGASRELTIKQAQDIIEGKEATATSQETSSSTSAVADDDGANAPPSDVPVDEKTAKKRKLRAKKILQVLSSPSSS